MKGTPELRKYPRVQMKVPVVFKLGETTSRIHSINLGGGGLRLVGSILPSGAEVEVRFRTAKHQAYIQTKARVVYALPKLGSGLEFTNIDPLHLQEILRAIHGRIGNRRKAPRVPLATQIHIQDSMALAYSRDLSVGGIFIDTKENFKLGTQADLRFHLNDDGPIVIASGEIRYIVPKLGVGVEFTQLSPEDRKRIEKFVETVE